MADEEQMPPTVAVPLEIQDQQREQQDVNRLRRLPPLEYDRMNRDQRLVFIRWYQQTAECREMFERYPKDSLEGIFTAYPTEEPADTLLKESLAKSFKSYVQQTWSSEGKQPPQPASYFLFHKRFSRLIDQGIYLPAHKDMVPALLFSLQEVDQIKNPGLETIITAVGSKELHFHQVGTLHPNDKETLYIYLKQNASYFLGANKEFMKQETTEVWFRRAKEGMPHFIFCPVSAELPALPLPLSTPGEPELVVELGRLESMPALHLERCKGEHRNDFYQWLLTKDESNMRDEDPESLKLAAHLFKLCPSDFNTAKPKIPRDGIARLYEKYVQERWSMPSKHLPEPQSVYLFVKKFQPADRFWTWLPSELMQQAVSLVLSTEDFDQLARLKCLFVMVSITTSTQIKLEKKGLLQKVETNYRISWFGGEYDDIVSHLMSEVNFEVWFLRTPNRPKFIIKPQRNRP